MATFRWSDDGVLRTREIRPMNHVNVSGVWDILVRRRDPQFRDMCVEFPRRPMIENIPPPAPQHTALDENVLTIQMIEACVEFRCPVSDFRIVFDVPLEIQRLAARAFGDAWVRCIFENARGLPHDIPDFVHQMMTRGLRDALAHARGFVASELADQRRRERGGRDDFLRLMYNYYTPNEVRRARHAPDGPEILTTEAMERAMRLLMSCLSPHQYKQFKMHGHFDVMVPDMVHERAAGRRRWASGRYRVTQEPTFNVIELATGERFCVQAAVRVPPADLMLAQKLLLENDPGEFFRVANRYGDMMRVHTDEAAGAIEDAHGRMRARMADLIPISVHGSNWGTWTGVDLAGRT